MNFGSTFLKGGIKVDFGSTFPKGCFGSTFPKGGILFFTKIKY